MTALTGILGGTFNPVHNGHVRLALEAGEVLGLERVLLMPCATPPHKPATGLLPFALRLALAEAAAAPSPLLGASGLEGELEGPSYTARLLPAWSKRHGALPFFFVGVEDFAQMPRWRKGLELPQLGRMVIAARGGAGRDLFFSVLKENWPGGRILPEAEAWNMAGLPGLPPPGLAAAFIEPQGLCLFLPVPRLDISASHIRRLWLDGRDASGLLPDGVLKLLAGQRELVGRVWAEASETEPDTVC